MAIAPALVAHVLFPHVHLLLGGFMAINRDKLRNLPGDKLAELAKTDELELTYIHLLSMNNFRRILERTAKANVPAAAE